MVADAQFTFAERLEQIRARAGRLRCEAFVDYSPKVCGIVLQPVTLASYNRLIAFGNPFAAGGAASVEAVLVWVWVHHALFEQDAQESKRRVLRAVWRSLHPRCPNLNDFLRLISTLPRYRWLKRWCVSPAAARFGEAVAEIRRLMAEALYGFPGPSGNDEPELDDEDDNEQATKTKRRGVFQAARSIAFQAQILNTFRRDYGMSYAETEAMPLKKLSQLWREHVFAQSEDKTGLSLMDRDEAALWREALEPEETRP